MVSMSHGDYLNEAKVTRVNWRFSQMESVAQCETEVAVAAVIWIGSLVYLGQAKVVTGI